MIFDEGSAGFSGDSKGWIKGTGEDAEAGFASLKRELGIAVDPAAWWAGT
jgi:hypothetical protein